MIRLSAAVLGLLALGFVQEDPDHQVFIKRNKKNCLRVEVFDFQ